MVSSQYFFTHKFFQIFYWDTIAHPTVTPEPWPGGGRSCQSRGYGTDSRTATCVPSCRPTCSPGQTWCRCSVTPPAGWRHGFGGNSSAVDVGPSSTCTCDFQSTSAWAGHTADPCHGLQSPASLSQEIVELVLCWEVLLYAAIQFTRNSYNLLVIVTVYCYSLHIIITVYP